MSETHPTQAEIEYLASLDMVRCDTCDRTSPALARKILKMQSESVRLKDMLRLYTEGNFEELNKKLKDTK